MGNPLNETIRLVLYRDSRGDVNGTSLTCGRAGDFTAKRPSLSLPFHETTLDAVIVRPKRAKQV